MNSVGKTKNSLTQTILSLMFFTSTLLSCGDNSTSSNTIPKLNPAQIPLTSLLLQQPKNCDEYKSYVIKSIIKRHTTIPDYAYCTSPESVINPDDRSPTTEKSPTGVSDTNNQEAGVNESDIVKVEDSGIVYIASGSHLVIAKGFPPQDLTTLKEINLDGHVTDLFLDKINQRVIVISRFETPYILEPAKTPTTGTGFAPAPVQGATDILFLDVNLPETPTVLKQLRIKGYIQTGRRIEDRLHLILRNSSNFYDIMDEKFWTLNNDFRQIAEQIKCDTGETDTTIIASNPKIIAAKEALTSHVTQLFSSVTITDYLPTAQLGDANNKLSDIPFLACSDIQHPEVSANLNMQVITSVNTDGTNINSTAMINNAWQTYVSKNNVYVAESSRNWWWDAPGNTIPTSQTAIYKFAISKQKPVYTATGTVEGYVNNQFSFSEFNGDLRVATTQDDWFNETNDKNEIIRRRELNNNVFVMRDNGNKSLEIIGEVRNFGKDENIRSSRFLGTRAFVVTFRNVDPLFTFDLTVPEAPQLMGELSIPGFSSYMHPYDDNHLLTIGRAGGDTGTGVGNGIQLQLFNISDLTKPVRVHSFTPEVPTGWSWSSAEYDHKAFTFYKPENLLAIPLQFYGSATTTGFSGVYAFNVDINTGFTLLGKVDHADLAKQYYCDASLVDRPNYQYECVDGAYVRWAAPRRSIVMTSASDVYLFTISDVGMKAGNVTDLTTTIGSILFPEQTYPYWYTIEGGIVLSN